MTDQVAQDLAKAVAAVVQGTHEITAVTIKPKREWQGLTDEDVQEVIKQSMQAITGGSNTFTLSANSVWTAIVRAVEAKLKEKNT